MRNRRGYFAAPDTGLKKEVLVGVGYMLWPSGMVVTVIACDEPEIAQYPRSVEKVSSSERRGDVHLLCYRKPRSNVDQWQK